MLYDGNFRLDESEPKLIELNFDIVELIRRNIEKRLGDDEISPFLVSHVEELESRFNRFPLVALPMKADSDCFYSITNHKSDKNGGFVYHNDKLFFAENLLNLKNDRDSYRQMPIGLVGRYYTDDSFEDIINSFEDAKIPLFRTIDDSSVYYDVNSWPCNSIPNLGEISYKDALEQLK